MSVGAEPPDFPWALSFVIWCLLGIDVQDGSRQMNQEGGQVISHEFQIWKSELQLNLTWSDKTSKVSMKNKWSKNENSVSP